LGLRIDAGRWQHLFEVRTRYLRERPRARVIGSDKKNQHRGAGMGGDRS
jgi:hypothetical protein